MPWLIASLAGAVDDRSWRFNLWALGAATAVSTVLGFARPAWWRRGLLTLALIPLPLFLITSHHVLAGLAALALLLSTAWLGRELAPALLGRLEPADAWVLGGAFGTALVALVGFVLGSLGILRPYVLWPLLLGSIAGLAATRRRPLSADLAALVAWAMGPVDRSAARFLVWGAALGCFWLNLIGALAPETGWDAVKLRLPVAALWARTGRLSSDDPDLWLATWPAAGEVVYAVALTIGPLQIAKLLNFGFGLFCAVGIFALGRRFGGAEAGGLAALAFCTMPVVSSVSTTAIADLLVCLFGVAAALAIVLRPGPSPRSAIAAGALLGVAVAAKHQFAYVAVGLAATLALLAARRAGLPDGLRLVTILSAAALLVAAPFLVRSYLATGEVFGLDLALAALRSSPEGSAAKDAIQLRLHGYPRSPADLLLAPYRATFEAWQFLGPRPGYIGYSLFAILPLLAIVRVRGEVRAMLFGAGVAFALWFYSMPDLRYGLPIFALLCPLAGAAYVGAHRSATPAQSRAIFGTLLVVLVAAGAILQVDRLKDTTEPDHPVVLGQTDEASYPTAYGHAYAALRLLDAEPGATRAFEPYEMYARLYTRVRLSSPFPLYTGGPLDFEGPDEGVLRRLDEDGYSHIVVDRGRLPDNWDRISAIDEGFLRRNTALVGGAANSYLYRLLPADRRGGLVPWARGSELLPNGGFGASRDGLPINWNRHGQPLYSASAAVGCNGGAAVLSTPRDFFSTRVAVTPGRQYLLSHATRSADGSGKARLQLNWLDAARQLLRSDIDVVPVSPRACHPYSMLATAPPDAVMVAVYALAQEGSVWFDDFSLRSVEPQAE